MHRRKCLERELLVIVEGVCVYFYHHCEADSEESGKTSGYTILQDATSLVI